MIFPLPISVLLPILSRSTAAAVERLSQFYCHQISGTYCIQNFVSKVYIVITSKVFADFCFESPISIDFQSEILALLPPKSAKTFHESLQILSPRKSARTFRILLKGRKYLQTLVESLCRHWR